jgi:serine/threonine-protein kinase HipA
VLAVRRYDRGPAGRIHQEDMAQAVGLPPHRKYDQVTFEGIAVLARRFIGEEAVEEFIRRLTLMLACGNNDAHLKNWSLLYQDRIRAAWSPLYDQVATVAWRSPDRETALNLAGVKAFASIDRRCLQRFAEKAQVDWSRAAELIDGTLNRLRATWTTAVEGLPLPAAHAAALREHWRRVPLLREAGPLEG